MEKTEAFNPPNCILHPKVEAQTTAAQIPVCKECWARYEAEARQYLPHVQRSFYLRLLEAADKQWHERRLSGR